MYFIILPTFHFVSPFIPHSSLEYTLMAQAVEKCFNKAMIRYFPKDEIDSDEEFSDKMMYGKRDRHKSKPNHFVKDEIKTLMDTTDDGLGTPKVNGFMSSNPASDVLQMITELKEEENPPQSILVPVQKKTTEVKVSFLSFAFGAVIFL